MAYIGKQATVGNFVKLDAIVTSATATYNLLNGGVAYSPQSANHCIVSLNGVIQSPNTSFTISGSTIVFASALTASDVIDFILVLGDVLNIGTPSDATVTNAKLALTAGSAGTPTISPAADTNTGIFFPAADTIGFAEGGTEAMRIDSDGDVGIGTTAPATKLHLISGTNTQNRIETTDTGSVAVTQYKNAAGETHTIGSETSSGNAGFGGSSAYSLCIYAGGTTRNIGFGTNGAERMRIDSSGNVIIGDTSTNHKFKVVDVNNRTEGTAQFVVAGSGYSLFNFLDGTAAYIGQNSNSRSLRIYSGSAASTGVNLAAGGTSWGTYSDERLKYEIENINDAITKIKDIRCISYKLKDVDTEISSKRLGVIAQSLVGKLDEVLDYSKKSEEDENEYISVRYSEIIPVLIKSIQEQQAIIEELKATSTSQQTKIDALEARLTTLENN